MGWDWLGANLDGGGALMAISHRGKDGAALWANATLRLPARRPSFPARSGALFQAARVEIAAHRHRLPCGDGRRDRREKCGASTR
jgi:hypothetical protein